MTVVVRPAAPRDDHALAVLDAEAWPPELWVVPPQSADQPFFDSRRRPEDVLVADEVGTVLGYARLARHLAIDSNAHVLHLNAVVVSPSARGRRVGSLLLDEAIAEARRRGARKLGLRVLSTNEIALGLYHRRGFVEEGRLRNEFRRPDGSFADDIWMALWLE